MRYPRELIEEIRMQNDIVEIISQYVPLKQKGNSYFGLCPFHHERTPSFSVNSEKQFYYCFGCGASGNVYSFLMEMENCDFKEAVQTLADRVHIELPKQELSGQALAMEQLKARLFEMHKLAGRFYYDTLQSNAGSYAKKYMEKRQILQNVARKFGIGYASNQRHDLYDYLTQKGFSVEDMQKGGLVLPNKDGSGYHDRFRNRLMFPIFDAQARVVGFGGRILGEGEPKYLNSPETPIFSKSRNLYGLHLAKASKRKEWILVEGYMDMISVYQAGFHNVVASLGTAFNADHVMTLKKYAEDVILLYDSDEAGTNAALRAIPVLVEHGFGVRVTQVPDGKDPDAFIKQYGAVAFSKLLVDAVHYISFEIACIKRNYNLDIPEHKVRFATEAAKILSGMENEIERNVYTAEVSCMTGVEENAIQTEIQKLQRKADAAYWKEAERKRIQKQKEHIYHGTEEKGVMDAQKNLLYLAANHRVVYDVLQDVLQVQDFPTTVYQKAWEYIGTLWQQHDTVFPAELLNFFETTQEQQQIGEVFAAQPPTDIQFDLQKAVNEAVRVLKRAQIEKMSIQVKTAEEIQDLVEQKRNLDRLHITI